MWVRNGRALAPPWMVCRIGVSTSRKPRPSRRVPDRPDHRGPGDQLAAGRRVDRQVEVALPDPGLRVADPAVLVGQRPQRLGRQQPRGHLQRQLAAPGQHHGALGADVVAEVDDPAQLGPAPATRPTAAVSISWASPLQSRSLTKITPPRSRTASTRPATLAAHPQPQLRRRPGRPEGRRVRVDAGVQQLLADRHPRLICSGCRSGTDAGGSAAGSPGCPATPAAAEAGAVASAAHVGDAGHAGTAAGR